eukprot:scaffold19019_cov14-Tisochrysis_lutea.AAC.1
MKSWRQDKQFPLPEAPHAFVHAGNATLRHRSCEFPLTGKKQGFRSDGDNSEGDEQGLETSPSTFRLLVSLDGQLPSIQHYSCSSS